MKGIVVGLAITALVLSCARNARHSDELTIQMEKMTEITSLWTQIRQFRADMKMDLEPPSFLLGVVRDKSINDAKRVCPDNHKVPKTCEDTCILSDHICENAKRICEIADELGKNDRAQEKCTSGKASCREAEQRCCNCSLKPPVPPPDVTPASPVAPAATPAPVVR